MVMIVIQDLTQVETLEAKAMQAAIGGHSSQPAHPWHEPPYMPSYEVPDIKALLGDLVKVPSPLEGPTPADGPIPIEDGPGGPVYGPF